MLHRACDKIIFFLPVILFHGIFDCGASNILCILVSAFTAESRALNSAGDPAPEGNQNTTAACIWRAVPSRRQSGWDTALVIFP